MQLQQAFTPPQRPIDGNSKLIHFRHPAYPDTEPDLLCLSALDGGGDGIDYDLALTSCVPGGPVFRPLAIPARHLPSPWKDLRLDSYATYPDAHLKSKVAALARDGTCRISGYCDAVEAAHLVPLADGHWFRSNSMERYCCLPAEPHPINDERNLVILRGDLHHLLDTRRFTFVAKSVATQPLSPHSPTVQLALHVMLPSRSDQLPSLYHNRALQHPVRGLAVEFLFARFAWTLFTDENMPFLNGFAKHSVLLFDPSEGRVDEETLRSAEVRKHAKLFESYSCSRSVSPRKRPLSSQPSSSQPRPPQTDAEAFETGSCGVPPFDLAASSDDGDEDWDAGDGGESSEEQWTRGRRRKRSFGTLERDDYDPPSLGASFVSASDASVATVPGELSPQEAPSSKGPASDEPPKLCSKRPRRNVFGG
ncbi:hypothetical protein C8A01DRAFT_31227 [Parachaetomium inaequale]|uniref:HNH nuclease domain-containing protein n=1 Tax=Parachaetomium inaequale TaxID=2588326 RepID=A0AAN6PSX2_9PEZI|nr:hypothetical protein C8A01DRAFT_31227 [Parachaetomium inaequale]